MELQLKNIGMIKEATVKIDGLTVIAGENDTGKSTVARELHYEVSSLGSIGRFPLKLGNRAVLIFKESEMNKNSVVLIDTPNSLDTFSFIKNATLLIHQQRLNIHLAMFRVDLILQLSQDIFENTKKNKIYKKIENIIDGRVFYDKNKDDILYEKYSLENRHFNMTLTSNGIKMFGYLQILLLNETLKKGSILILDEPEVHLHPKWQLKYAELIIELVKNGVKIVVNSHSPYIIEALKRYSDKENLQNKTNFYLAENGYIGDKNKLQEIYEKLSEPYDEFDRMDSDILNGK